jgi:hypothetical protein
MLDAVLQARYSLILSKPTFERARAQTAYSIAGAFAVALIAGGVAGPVQRFEPFLQWVAFAATLAWFFSAILHLRVAAYSRAPSPLEGATVNAKTLIDGSLRDARVEAMEIASRLRVAVISSIVALTLTVGALGGAWLRGPALVKSQVILTDLGQSVLSTSCNHAKELHVWVEVEAGLDEPFIRLEKPAECAQDIIFLPTAEVAAIREL